MSGSSQSAHSLRRPTVSSAMRISPPAGLRILMVLPPSEVPPCPVGPVVSTPPALLRPQPWQDLDG